MIRMTKQADYGTVLLTFFAREHDKSMLSARDLAGRAQLPLPTVTKILKMLARGGVLVSHRGVKGGYSLARPAERITVAEIITALEGPIAITQCSLNARGCDQEPVCPVRPNWQRIDHAVRHALDEVTLAEMAHPGPDEAPCKTAASVSDVGIAEAASATRRASDVERPC